jgi:lipopolysaccharide/colanic/teichoic acid biosynthesis glycosyltransferase
MKFVLFRKLALFTGDIIILYLSLSIMLILGFGSGLNVEIIHQHVIPFSILYLFWIIIFIFFGLYDLRLLKKNSYLISRLTLSLLVSGLISVLFFYLFPSITPKTNLAIYLGLLWLFLVMYRKVFMLISSSYFKSSISINNNDDQANELKKFINDNPQLGFSMKENDSDITVTQGLSNYKDILGSSDILNITQAYELILKRIPVNSINQDWILSNVVKKELYDKSKRLMDVILAFIILLITFPLIIIAGILIKIGDGGPMFYIEERVGQKFKKIWVIKLRTMREGQNGTPWTQGSKDPRITSIGKILRLTHIDELPQLINILKGDLSLIGPRAESINTVKFLEKEIPYYHLRHFIKPGCTGWAQLDSAHQSNVGEMYDIKDKIKYDFRKVEYDLYYIKNRSLALDAIILLKSLKLFMNNS